MRITLHPDPALLATSEDSSFFIKRFLSSLGVENVDDWRSPIKGEVVVNDRTGTFTARIFGMSAPIPEEVTNTNTWRFGIESVADSADIFRINGTPISAICREKNPDLTPLASLSRLTSLNLADCKSLTDLTPLASLFRLIKLNLNGCNSLIDLTPLASLKRLTSIDLARCNSLSNLTPLSSLSQLTSLNLARCKFLTDLTPLASLKRLTDLKLWGCVTLTDLTPLASLSQLTSLDLAHCKSLTDLTPLASLSKLTTLSLSECLRIRTIDPLRSCPQLGELESPFHPAEVAELLADLAAQRRDTALIREHADNWLKELVAEAAGTAQQTTVDTFATTLARAFCLLGEHEITARFQAWMNEKPDLSPQPWSAWFRGTLAENGFDLFRSRAEKTSVTDLTPGAIGGIAAVVAGFEDEAHRIWGQKWLVTVDDHWADRAKELLPAAPELCLANEKLGRRDAVQLWLERFTDPSDAAALDPVHEVLARWLLAAGKLAEAEIRISQVSSAELRDPVLAKIARAHLATNPNEASSLLLTIESPEIRAELALELACDTEFTGNPKNVHVLLAAAGSDPAAIARLLDTIAVHKPDSPMLEELRSAIAAPETDAAQIREWRLEQLEKLQSSL